MRIWFITGASRGLGAELVASLLAAGEGVVATARRPEALGEQFGAPANLLAVRQDVTIEREAGAAVAAAIEQFGRIDVLVNNAGYGMLGAIEESTDEEARKLYDTNVFGLLNTTRAVLPRLRAQGAGHIINLSSLGGYQATAGWGIYCSSKAAVEGISEALVRELAPLGIRVTIVAPAFFRSDFLEGSSLVLTEAKIDAYRDTVGAARDYVAASVNIPGAGQAGCSLAVLADAIRQVVDAPEPPLRLMLGKAALRRVAEKHANVDADIAKWRTLSEAADG
jgi:NAD(P)-dependent dehydrogenase (short-subunit alcohol dehydrogenase family)